jgi:hypothetical protein
MTDSPRPPVRRLAYDDDGVLYLLHPNGSPDRPWMSLDPQEFVFAIDHAAELARLEARVRQLEGLRDAMHAEATRLQAQCKDSIPIRYYKEVKFDEANAMVQTIDGQYVSRCDLDAIKAQRDALQAKLSEARGLLERFRKELGLVAAMAYPYMNMEKDMLDDKCRDAGSNMMKIVMPLDEEIRAYLDRGTMKHTKGDPP